MAAGKSFFNEALADTPWRIGDLYRLGTRTAIGLIGLLVAWAGASRTTDFSTQVVWIGVAVAVVVVSIAGAIAWLVSGLGAVGAERRAVASDVRERWGAPSAPDDAAGLTVPGLVVGDGMRRYHLASCDVVRSKAVVPVTRADADRRGLVGCGMCGS